MKGCLCTGWVSDPERGWKQHRAPCLWLGQSSRVRLRRCGSPVLPTERTSSPGRLIPRPPTGPRAFPFVILIETNSSAASVGDSSAHPRSTGRLTSMFRCNQGEPVRSRQATHVSQPVCILGDGKGVKWPMVPPRDTDVLSVCQGVPIARSPVAFPGAPSLGTGGLVFPGPSSSSNQWALPTPSSARLMGGAPAPGVCCSPSVCRSPGAFL